MKAHNPYCRQCMEFYSQLVGGPRRGEKTEMQKGISSIKKEVVITILE